MTADCGSLWVSKLLFGECDGWPPPKLEPHLKEAHLFNSRTSVSGTSCHTCASNTVGSYSTPLKDEFWIDGYRWRTPWNNIRYSPFLLLACVNSKLRSALSPLLSWCLWPTWRVLPNIWPLFFLGSFESDKTTKTKHTESHRTTKQTNKY